MSSLKVTQAYLSKHSLFPWSNELLRFIKLRNSLLVPEGLVYSHDQGPKNYRFYEPINYATFVVIYSSTDMHLIKPILNTRNIKQNL